MTMSDFHSKYPGLPLSDRFIPLNISKTGLATLASINAELQVLGDAMRPLEIRMEDLLEKAEKGFSNLKRKNEK